MFQGNDLNFKSEAKVLVTGVAVAALLILAAAFVLGRCTAQHNVKFQSPITVQEARP